MLRRAGILRFSNALATVLVVGALIGASLLWFRPAPGSSLVTQAPPGPAPHSTPVLIQAEHGGLKASLTLTGGPYFLSETLAVDMTLTNHTSTTLTLVGFPEDGPCGAVLTLDMISAQPPTFPPPPHVIVPCPLGSHPLEPGQTLTIHHYETLTASGQVTLTEGARFMTTQKDATGTQHTTPSPLEGYWPSVTIAVSAQVPQASQFSFKQEGARVVVTAPAGAQPYLLYRYVVLCQDAQGPGNTEILQSLWQPLATTTVHEPGCPGIHSQWAFAFSAPGYATVAGSACVVRQEVNC